MCLNCHVVTLDIELKDLDAMEAACTRIGATLKKNCHKHHWYGRWVDDSPVPRNLLETEEDYQKMLALPRHQRQQEMLNILRHPEHVITIPGHTYEVGIYKVGNRLEMAFDEFHGKWGNTSGGELAQAYAIEASKNQARRQGLNDFTETVQQDGAIQLAITIPEY